ncbi:MAG: hypothetical protein M3007_07060 [Candidatus Eremiobacteraeota bacterium]|nr:hypothetical protein [Candidatus Eremiobacteraeota bacterium]
MLVPLPAAARLKPVNVGIRIDNLADVDELRERWEMTGALVTSWLEPRLKYQSQGRDHDHRDISPSLVQLPNIGFANAIGTPSLERVDLFVRPDGEVVEVQNFRASLSTHLDLRRFPFDAEDLPIFIVPMGRDVNPVRLVPDTAHTRFAGAPYSTLAQWQFLSLTIKPHVEHYVDDTAEGLQFALQMRRSSQSYFWKFILPLCLIVVVSWISFWLSPTEFKSKDLLSTAVTTLLIIVAFTLSITALLPRTSYLTYIDGFLLTCFLFVIAAIGSIAAINIFESKGRDGRALALRKITGVVLPLSFILVQLAVFAYFRS